MFSRVEARNNQGQTEIISLFETSNGLVISDFQGLDPVKSQIVSSPFAQRAGSQYQASRREARNMVLKLDVVPDYVEQTVQSIRSRLYDIFMPQSKVDLKFYLDDIGTVDIRVDVEDFDFPQFTAEPRAVITMLGLEPDFLSSEKKTVTGRSTPGTENIVHRYDGNIESGFLLTMTVPRSVPSITIFHQPSDNTLRTLEFVYPLLPDDTIEISTVPGSKGATLVRNNVRSSALMGISPQSEWLSFFKGDNQFRVAIAGESIPYTIEYTPRYGAI